MQVYIDVQKLIDRYIDQRLDRKIDQQIDKAIHKSIVRLINRLTYRLNNSLIRQIDRLRDGLIDVLIDRQIKQIDKQIIIINILFFRDKRNCITLTGLFECEEGICTEILWPYDCRYLSIYIYLFIYKFLHMLYHNTFITDNKASYKEGGRRHCSVYYSSLQSCMITFSYLLP